ncbi:MAG: hypothetical protein JWL69_4512 [Phycisphaerales bacterium]|nr:hypothetical protein [Phycisphaerales bacterium]
MSPDRLPEELAQLERRLYGRVSESPSAELRGRIMGAVTRELASEMPSKRAGGRDWEFLAAIAAVLLIGLNLSAFVSSSTHSVPRPMLSVNQTNANSIALRRLSPDLSEAEARRMSVLLAAGEGLDCVPTPRSMGIAGRVGGGGGVPNSLNEGTIK